MKNIDFVKDFDKEVGEAMEAELNRQQSCIRTAYHRLF